MHKGRRFDMADIPKPLNGDFLLLETINKEKGASRTAHMVIPNRTEEIFKLGRGHEADIRVTDISVSRLHAVIKCTKEGFILKDNHAKFGTLVCRPKKMAFSFDERPMLQVGRTMIVAEIKNSEPNRYHLIHYEFTKLVARISIE